MTWRAMLVAAALTIGAVAGGFVLRPRPVPPAATTVNAPGEAEIRTADIAFYERRANEDPFSAGDRARLAALHLQRARETGSAQDYRRAEEHARRSIAIRSDHNDESFVALVSALVARHEFGQALQVARTLHARDTSNVIHTALLAEIELETGDYENASRRFAPVAREANSVSVAARVARWHELTGRTDAARRLLRGAAARLARRRDVPREQIAWFHYRSGEVELRIGRLEAADSAFQRALAVFPDDYRALDGLARVAAARRDWVAAIDFASRAIAIRLDPGTLGTLSEAYAASNDTARSRQVGEVMAATALSDEGPIHRGWGTYLLDHGREIEAVLRRARADIAVRRDVYGYDLLAWALFKNGHAAEARRAMARALSAGTEDAQLHYHAGMIALANADSAGAREHLERAMSLNPAFSPSQAPIARGVLDSLTAAQRSTRGLAAGGVGGDGV